MSTNPYFSWNELSEQGLYDDLVTEFVKMYGYDVYILPREAVAIDMVFGEDILQRFPRAIQVEVYIENVEGFGGEGDIFSKFGFTPRDRITFTVARRRWDELQKNYLMTEEGYPLLDESANTLLSGPGTPALLAEGANSAPLRERPGEDDLIYFPLTKKLYEIKHVEHEKLFYPLGRFPVYQLKCELWEASSERIDTGIADIDLLGDKFSLDAKNYEILDEEGNPLQNEDGGSIIAEEERPETAEPQATNSELQKTADNTVHFGEWNPLSGKRTY